MSFNKPKNSKLFISPLFFLALGLSLLGLLNLNSATQTVVGSSGDSPFLRQQMLYLLVALAGYFFSSQILLRVYAQVAPYFYIGTIFLLLFVLIFGAKVNGSQSWIDLGVLRLQPSEFGKLSLVLLLAWQLNKLGRVEHLGFRELIMPLAIFLLPAYFIILQNDMGSSLFYGFVFISMILVRGVKISLLVTGVFMAVLLCWGSFHFVLKPYQKNRVFSFMNPEHDPRGSGYHLVQSKIAVGSGGVWGKGYLKGASHRLKYLPERHTDFVFPVWLEEWGFFGGALVLGVYFLFLFFLLNQAARTENAFGYFVAIGMTAIFFWHMVINLGGVLGLMPLTGVPLPFFSYGGSALVANWLAVGITQAVGRSS